MNTPNGFTALVCIAFFLCCSAPFFRAPTPSKPKVSTPLPSGIDSAFRRLWPRRSIEENYEKNRPSTFVGRFSVRLRSSCFRQ